MPADFRVSITNPPGKERLSDRQLHLAADSRQPADANKGKIIKDFLAWMLDKGQGMVTRCPMLRCPPR